MANRMLTPEEIDRQLSDNFNGDFVEEYDSFNGKGLVESYIGNDSQFQTSTKRFGFAIANTTSRRVDIALTPAHFPILRNIIAADDNGTVKIVKPGGGKVAVSASAGSIVTEWNNPEEIKNAGFRIDCLADDGVIFADSTGTVTLSADKPEASYRAFRKFVEKHPTKFAGMHITCKNPDMFSSSLKLRKVTPFAIYGEKLVPFQDAYTSGNMNSNKIEVRRDFQLDGETVGVLSVPADTTVSFSFVAKAVISLEKGLKGE